MIGFREIKISFCSLNSTSLLCKDKRIYVNFIHKLPSQTIFHTVSPLAYNCQIKCQMLFIFSFDWLLLVRLFTQLGEKLKILHFLYTWKTEETKVRVNILKFFKIILLIKISIHSCREENHSKSLYVKTNMLSYLDID